MTPRQVRTVTSGAIASVALAVTGASFFSAQHPAPKQIEQSAVTEAPAVVSPQGGGVTVGQRGQSVSTGLRDKALRTAVLTDIPPTALAAYQRAAASMAAADAGCRLPWSVLAAVGQVESDHGRTTSRNARGIVGVPLNGKGVAAVADTDAGLLDGDAKFDRAVGPMQILPSTWSTVAVDGDGDGKRDPQDIDDAALGAAVYLCGSGADLSTDAGQKKALSSYNNSASYVRLVMSIASSYAKDQKASYASMSSGGVDLRSIGSTEGVDAKTAERAEQARAAAKKTAAAKAAKAAADKKTAKPAVPATPGKPTPPRGTDPAPTHPTAPTTGDPSAPAPGGSTSAPTDPKKYAIPSVIAKQFQQAVDALRTAAGHFVGEQTDSAYDPAPAGQVLVQTTGDAASGATVALTVSLGPVTNVVSMTYAEAKAALADQGLVTATTGAAAADDATVTGQTPDHVSKGGTVTLTLQSAPAPTAGSQGADADKE